MESRQTFFLGDRFYGYGAKDSPIQKEDCSPGTGIWEVKEEGKFVPSPPTT